MKRCPQCDFIYLDTDEVCDLDGSKLIEVNEPELPARNATLPNPKKKRSNLRPILIAGIGGVLLGAILVTAYLLVARSRQQTQDQIPTQQVQQTTPTPVQVAVLPTPEASPSPAPSPTDSPKTKSQVEPTKRGNVSKGPVSTSTTDKSTGQISILLSNGARIEADEAWRTKEGVWYRRNGVVTLIKANRVKAIEKAK